MSLFRICTGAAIAAGFLMLATLGGAGDYVAPGAYAGEYARIRSRHAAPRKNREYAVEQGSTPEEIARYFALHGGNIDPSHQQAVAGRSVRQRLLLRFGHRAQRRQFTVHELKQP